jgi:hypothetical protein
LLFYTGKLYQDAAANEKRVELQQKAQIDKVSPEPIASP